MSKHITPTSQRSQKTNTELLQKGIMCVLIGGAVLLSPRFISSPGMQGIVANSSLVGWFALVLGCAFLLRYALLRRKSPSNQAE